jgi:hypothetical protein
MHWNRLGKGRLQFGLRPHGSQRTEADNSFPVFGLSSQECISAPTKCKRFTLVSDAKRVGPQCNAMPALTPDRKLDAQRYCQNF